MSGISAMQLAVAVAVTLAAILGPGWAASAQDQVVPVNICSDQSTDGGQGETGSTGGSTCEAGNSAIPDQEHQGNGNFSGGGNGNLSGQGNNQGNGNLNDQLQGP